MFAHSHAFNLAHWQSRDEERRLLTIITGEVVCIVTYICPSSLKGEQSNVFITCWLNQQGISIYVCTLHDNFQRRTSRTISSKIRQKNPAPLDNRISNGCQFLICLKTCCQYLRVCSQTSQRPDSKHVTTPFCHLCKHTKITSLSSVCLFIYLSTIFFEGWGAYYFRSVHLTVWKPDSTLPATFTLYQILY